MTQKNMEKRRVGTPHVSMVTIEGAFAPNGSSAISTTPGSGHWGQGFVVTRTGVGTYRVTITRPFAAVYFAHAQLMTADAVTVSHDVAPSAVVLPTSSANGYVDFVHKTSADLSATNWAAADINAAVTSRIFFSISVAESDVPGNGV